MEVSRTVHGVDYAALFDATSSPCAVLDLNFVIVEVNQAFCRVTSRERAQLLGASLVEMFPDNPDPAAPSGSETLLSSLRQARRSGRPHVMAPLRYDLADAQGGRYVERYWSIVNSPVLDADGRTVLLLNRPEEITDFVLGRTPIANPDTDDDPPGSASNAEMFARAQELQAAWQAETKARNQLLAVSQVALQLWQAQTVQDLAAMVIDRGLAALGADGGAVAVLAGDHLDLTITSSLGEHTQTEYSRLPLHGPLPACVAATGSPVVLRDRAASLAWAPEMADVLESTGCQSWVSLPLYGETAILGSLTVGWSSAQPGLDTEMDVLTTLAAQCGYGLERIQIRHAEQQETIRTRRMSETLQRSLLTAPMQPDHLELAVRYEPAAQDAQVGGDWYDAFLTRDGALCTVIGDVAGHDRDAAAAMGQLRNLLRGIAYSLVEPPAVIVDALDGAVARLAVPGIATVVFGEIEQVPADAAVGMRTFRWCNAGHPPPIVVEPDGRVVLLTTEPDVLLGTRHAPPRTDHTHPIAPGATLLLYTDGLVERRGVDLDTGLAWLTDAMARLAHAGLDELCDGLLAETEGHAEDDVALLAVRAHPEDRARPSEAGPQILPPAETTSAPHSSTETM